MSPFTTTRLLVGDFKAAESLLSELMKKVGCGGFWRLAPKMLIHPLEMVDGGLSPVEERLFLELGMGAGARQTRVYVGAPLGDDSVKERLSKVWSRGAAD